MKKTTLAILVLLALAALPLNAQKKFVAEKLEKCDPYMKAQGGYGYLVKNDSKAAVWWAEGCYKVMKDTPVAKRRGGTVKLKCSLGRGRAGALESNRPEGEARFCHPAAAQSWVSHLVSLNLSFHICKTG